MELIRFLAYFSVSFLAVLLLTYFLVPYLRWLWDNYLFKKQLNWLKENSFQIFENVGFAVESEVDTIDYVVLTVYGVFFIKIVRLSAGAYKNSFIRGDEREKQWIRGKVFSPFFFGKKTKFREKEKITNPFLELKKYMKKFNNLLNQFLINFDFTAIPVVVIMPTIRGVSVFRNKGSRAKLIFPASLERIIRSFRREKISRYDLFKIKKVIETTDQFIFEEEDREKEAF